MDPNQKAVKHPVKRPGRPSMKTPERVEALLGWLRRGAHRKTACALSGIDRETLRLWMQQDSWLVWQVEQAEAEAEMAAVEQVKATGHAPSILKWLGMRFARFREKSEKTLTHRYEDTPTEALEKLRQEALARLEEARANGELH